MTYELTEESLTELKQKKLDDVLLASLEKLLNQEFDKEMQFLAAIGEAIGESLAKQHQKEIIQSARKYYAVLTKKSDRQALLAWWQALEEISLPNGKTKSNRGERAKLRRCDKPEDVLLQPYFFALQQQLPDIGNALALASVAGLLAHVKSNGEYNFPRQLGKENEHSGKPMLSEMRFQQLLASRDEDDLYENLRRAIVQLKRKAHVLSLADGVLHWAKERHDKNQFSERPEQRFQYTWAKAYFNEVLAYSKP